MSRIKVPVDYENDVNINLILFHRTTILTNKSSWHHSAVNLKNLNKVQQLLVE